MKLDQDYQVLRCPECRTRRVDKRLMVMHRLGCIRPLCRCGGYHFAHRPGSRFCWLNPFAALNDAIRRGESEEVLLDILIDMTWDNPGLTGKQGTECPF